MNIDWTASKRKWVAIDFDSRQVRLVVFQHVHGQPVIRSLHVSSVPAGPGVADAPAMGRLLKTLADRLHLAGARAVLSVGREQVALKSLLLPPGTSSSELPAMVQFQVAKELPFAADEAVVDFTPGAHWDSGQAEAGGNGVTVLAAAVRLPVLEAAKGMCAEAGLRLQRLTFRPYANLRALCRCVDFQPSERVLFVNLTADEAEIDVIADQTLEFSRTAGLRPASVPGQQPADGPTAESREATVKRVVGEVNRSLAGFSATQRGAGINACLVAGSTGIEDDLVAELRQTLGVPCEPFEPSGGFGIVPDEQVSGFSAALGMATWREAEAAPLDFLNPKRPVPPRDARKIQLAVAGGAAALVLFGGVLAGSLYLGGYRDELKRLEERNRTLVATNKQLRLVQRPVKDVQDWLAGDVDWLDQLAHLSNTLPSADQTYLTSFNAKAGNLVSLAGRAKDGSSVSAFAEELMGMPGYTVRARGTTPVKDPHGYGSQFTLDVLVSPQAKPVLTTTHPVGPPIPPAPPAPPRATRAGGPPVVQAQPQPPQSSQPTPSGDRRRPRRGG